MGSLGRKLKDPRLTLAALLGLRGRQQALALARTHRDPARADASLGRAHEVRVILGAPGESAAAWRRDDLESQALGL